jgi:hypothetical protein
MKIDKVKIAYDKGYRVIDNNIVYLKTGHVRALNFVNNPRMPPYPRFTICHNQKRVSILAHQLCAYQKYGPVLYANAMVVRHKDNDYLNFSQSNILLGTQSENCMDVPVEKRLENSRKGVAAREETEEEILF